MKVMKYNGVRELDFERAVGEFEVEDSEIPPSCQRERSYRWQDDPRRYDPPKEKRRR